MRIETNQFPLVWLQKATQGYSQEDSLAQFEALLARHQPFVLLSNEGLDKEQTEHSPDEMKQMALWMKRHKSELKQYVKASIHVESSLAKRLAGKAFSVVYEKFWGYPMLMTATEDEALLLAETLLKPKVLKAAST
ncbi:hypothetical protein V2K00_04130 [Pseudomonas alliivorans]|uniref:Uncharacterized protein n=1 Tax=Pseudomonas alliivorans TaxID=2810613 RepID=A0ABS4C3D5_9PSED|nr:hypothetical protein [Pseudomonas alliivorans]MBP0945146.1 hypothetical protein [Pseudomonas alliivorans]MEE4324403.1 hypothetical protein [Pseudomonas alliivorans]MEE4334339.1 hypothetical protein [Pseudomonas alliivorans]MEE4365933.1 hypothetical protein [Pseudomonas alliivorans]MEE5093511.1 hypothetical protein [Pseudomonas alliivorans]